MGHQIQKVSCDGSEVEQTREGLIHILDFTIVYASREAQDQAAPVVGKLIAEFMEWADPVIRIGDSFCADEIEGGRMEQYYFVSAPREDIAKTKKEFMKIYRAAKKATKQ